MTITLGTELHLWRADLSADGWAGAEGLPAEERERAARIPRADAGRRWVAARWALREVLGRYLDRDPAAIELRFGERGKPMLADPAASLRFNLSHSGGLALIALSAEREVGVDVQLIGSRPAQFYTEWARREAIVKCHGTGLWAPPTEAVVSVTELDAGAEHAAAVAVAGERMPPIERFEAEPRASAQ